MICVAIERGRAANVVYICLTALSDGSGNDRGIKEAGVYRTRTREESTISECEAVQIASRSHDANLFH